MQIKIPVYKPSLNGNEKKYVNECLDTNWISSKGDFVGKFEKQFAEYVKTKHATSVSNGTVALHLALVALGIGPGDEVIVPTFNYIASVNAIAYTGAKPVFVDSEREYWQIDPEAIKHKITPRTKAILAVHLYGHPCNLERLVEIKNNHNLFLIEDCAEALGSYYKDRHVGTLGDIATYSFYGNKTITTGEGGMVTTNDETLCDRVVHYKGQGLAKYREYWHDVIGYNYRMTNICAAIGLAQLENIEDTLIRKKQVADYYRNNLPSQVQLHGEADDCIHSYWMCTILTSEAKEREALRNHLKENGIETRPSFYPVHTMPMYSKEYERHSNAEYIGWRGINLPSYPGLSRNQLEMITSCINSFYEG